MPKLEPSRDVTDDARIGDTFVTKTITANRDASIAVTTQNVTLLTAQLVLCSGK